MTVTLLTVAEYARHRGCDEKAVRKALAEGRISRIGSERRCIDAEVADIQWARNTRARAQAAKPPGAGQAAQASAPAVEAPQQPAPPPSPPEPGYQDHRARRELADAERAELEVARMAGRLIDRPSVEKAVGDAFRVLRDRAFAMPRQVAPSLVGLTEVREIEQLLIDALRIAFDTSERDGTRAIESAVTA